VLVIYFQNKGVVNVRKLFTCAVRGFDQCPSRPLLCERNGQGTPLFIHTRSRYFSVCVWWRHHKAVFNSFFSWITGYICGYWV
jgi:hypothetical protein